MDIRSLINDAPAAKMEKPSQSARPLSTPTSAVRGNWSQASPSPVSNGASGQSAVFPAAGYPPPGRNEFRHSAPTYGQSYSSTTPGARSSSYGTPYGAQQSPSQNGPGRPSPRDESVSPKTMLPPQPYPLQTPPSGGGVKRSAVESGETPPPKKLRSMRKHTERPVWARLNLKNPRAPAHLTKAHNNHETLSIAAANKANKPSLETLPIDHDMLLMRKLLAGPWERSIKGSPPLASFTKAVADWFAQQLRACEGICQDPAEGQIEIEAKVGRLFDSSTGQRLKLPVANMVVLEEPFATAKCTFQSEMQEHEYMAMRESLRKLFLEKHEEPGHPKLRYEHIQEIDTFQRLSNIGLSAVPEAVAKRQIQRDLKLRTTEENDPMTNRVGQIKARIVKVKLADLHIYNPQSDYDLRITMNVECNLMQPELELDPGALAEEPTPERPNQPARKKDRVSYKHLGIYQIDLTKVQYEKHLGMAPKYELELEVDAGVLREQLGRLLRRGESGFTHIVDGFIDNATWLMTAAL